MALIDTSRILPELYYRDHAISLLEVVRHLYLPLLSDEECHFMNQLSALPVNAQCLYVRLVNRKPDVFALSELNYQEIQHLDEAALTLHAYGFVAYDGKNHITIHKRALWKWLLFLYFGQPEDNLGRFAVFDLRINKAEPYSLDALQPHFTCRADAERSFQAHLLYQEYRAMRDKMKAPLLSIAIWFLNCGAGDTLRRYDAYQRLVFSLGRRLEREKYITHAFMVYQHGNTADSLERKTRLLMRWKDIEAACKSAQALLASDSVTEKQRIYAQRILKQCAPKSALPEMHIRLPYKAEMPVEHEVLDMLQQEGWQGAHCENHIWRQLHALLLWDVLHNAEVGGIHHPLQLGTNQMRCNMQFQTARMDMVTAALANITSQQELMRLLQASYTQYAGLPNRFCCWTEHAELLLTRLCETVPFNAVRTILHKMSEYIATHRCGFPDLFVWRDGEHRFLEVKSPNDTISDIQYFWHQEFIRLKLPISVCHVSWQ